MGTLTHRHSERASRSDPVARAQPRRLVSIAVWSLGVVLFLILLIPVLLLPVSTAVPVWVWSCLLLADAGLAVWLLRARPARVRAALLGAVALVAVAAVIVSQLFAATPAISSADGRPVPGGIASLRR